MKRSPLSRRAPLKRSAFRPKKPDAEKIKAAKRRRRQRARDLWERDFGPHADFVRERGCEVPGCPNPAQSHHEPPRANGCTMKDQCGLCLEHHTEGRYARHKIGLKRFDAYWSTDLIAAAARNWAASPYGEKADGDLV